MLLSIHRPDSWVGRSCNQHCFSECLPLGRHELPVDLAASNDDGPHGMLWSGPTDTLSCSTTPATFCTDDATAVFDISPKLSPSIVLFTHDFFDGTHFWPSTCTSDDATRSMPSTSLGTIASTHYDDSLPSVTAHHGMALPPPCSFTLIPTQSTPQEAPPAPHATPVTNVSTSHPQEPSPAAQTRALTLEVSE